MLADDQDSGSPRITQGHPGSGWFNKIDPFTMGRTSKTTILEPLQWAEAVGELAVVSMIEDRQPMDVAISDATRSSVVSVQAINSF